MCKLELIQIQWYSAADWDFTRALRVYVSMIEPAERYQKRYTRKYIDDYLVWWVADMSMLFSNKGKKERKERHQGNLCSFLFQNSALLEFCKSCRRVIKRTCTLCYFTPDQYQSVTAVLVPSPMESQRWIISSLPFRRKGKKKRSCMTHLCILQLSLFRHYYRLKGPSQSFMAVVDGRRALLYQLPLPFLTNQI